MKNMWMILMALIGCVAASSCSAQEIVAESEATENQPSQLELDPASKLRNLIKRFEDDPVQSEIDRAELLRQVRGIVERLNRKAGLGKPAGKKAVGGSNAVVSAQKPKLEVVPDPFPESVPPAEEDWKKNEFHRPSISLASHTEAKEIDRATTCEGGSRVGGREQEAGLALPRE